MRVVSRSICLTGGSTYIISLPKEWIKMHGLSKGSQVSLLLLSDGSLLVRPTGRPKTVDNIVTIKIDDSMTPDKLVRKLIAYYIAGYDIIEVKAPEGMSLDFKNSIRSAIKRMLFGAELVDESMEYIRIQILTRSINIPIDKLLTRMSNIALNMHLDAMRALRSKDRDILKEIIERDDDVDRLYFLIVRLLASAIYKPYEALELGISDPIEALEYRLVARHLERVADHATIISSMYLDILNELNHSIVSILSRMCNAGKEALTLAMDSLVNMDLEKAEKAIKKRFDMRDLEDEAVNKLYELGNPRVIAALRMAIESYRRVSEYSAGIAEIAINISARKSNIKV